jgi:hypothetical protein
MNPSSRMLATSTPPILRLPTELLLGVFALLDPREQVSFSSEFETGDVHYIAPQIMVLRWTCREFRQVSC